MMGTSRSPGWMPGRPPVSIERPSPETLRALWRNLGESDWLRELFDRLPDVVFSLKDREGRYLWISLGVVERCGLRSREAALGKRAMDIYPEPMARRYEAQDAQLFRSGRTLLDSLDLTLFPGRAPGWCLTHKVPLRSEAGVVSALACLSRDLAEPSRAGLVDARFADTLDHLQAHLAEPLGLGPLAERAGLSPAAFERRMKRLFGLSPAQYVLKRRIEAVMDLLDTAEPLCDIAQAVGFCDQAALTRAFKRITGLTPGAWRRRNPLGGTP